MRVHLSSPTLLSFVLAFVLPACSGTDTVSGTGGSPDPSGTGTGKVAREEDPTDPGEPMTPDETPDEGEVPAPGDPPEEDPKDPTDPPASGIDGVIDVPQSIGTTEAADFVLSQAKKTNRLAISVSNIACPVAISTAQAPYVYVQLKNKGAKRALMSLWTASTGAGPANTANALAIYPGPTPPASDAAREQCLGTVSYSCSASPCIGWPGLASSAGDAVEVPANGSVIVFVQGEVSKTGSFKLSVRTDFLQ